MIKTHPLAHKTEMKIQKDHKPPNHKKMISSAHRVEMDIQNSHESPTLAMRIPVAHITETDIQNSHEVPSEDEKIPEAHMAEMKIQKSHELPKTDSFISSAARVEMEIKKNHEDHPLQTHPVISSAAIPATQDTEKNIADIQQRVLNEEKELMDSILDGVPSGEPGLSNSFFE